jgi:hypothetical protein
MRGAALGRVARWALLLAAACVLALGVLHARVARPDAPPCAAMRRAGHPTPAEARASLSIFEAPRAVHADGSRTRDRIARGRDHLSARGIAPRRLQPLRNGYPSATSPNTLALVVLGSEPLEIADHERRYAPVSRAPARASGHLIAAIRPRGPPDVSTARSIG